METKLLTRLVVAVLAVSSITAHAAVANKPHSRTLVVQSPSNLPVLAQKDSDAMYLHLTSDGRSLLYIEAEDGCILTVLDVTDPAKIQRVAQAPLAAPSAFDFVKPIGDDSALVRYRNGSGAALLSFTNYKRPELVGASAVEGTEASEKLGATGLLSTSANVESDPISDPISDPTYQVWDSSKASRPQLLATIPGVTQRLSKENTGTLFLLTKDGITVIRRLRVEEEHKVNVISRSQT
jgi:hypothetical protein